MASVQRARARSGRLAGGAALHSCHAPAIALRQHLAGLFKATGNDGRRDLGELGAIPIEGHFVTRGPSLPGQALAAVPIKLFDFERSVRRHAHGRAVAEFAHEYRADMIILALGGSRPGNAKAGRFDDGERLVERCVHIEGHDFLFALSRVKLAWTWQPDVDGPYASSGPALRETYRR